MAVREAMPMVDIVIEGVRGGIVYARRVRTEDDVRAGRRFDAIVWAHLEELDTRPKPGEVITITQRDYEDCEVVHGA